MSKFDEIPGFISWKETFYGVTCLVQDIIGNHIHARNNYPGLFDGIETQGSIWLRDLCVTIADEFEEVYPEEDWMFRDYFDTVYDFTTMKLSEL